MGRFIPGKGRERKGQAGGQEGKDMTFSVVETFHFQEIK